MLGGLKNLFYCKIADLCVHVYTNANRLKILMIYKTGYTVAYSKSVLQMFSSYAVSANWIFFLTSHELDFQLRWFFVVIYNAARLLTNKSRIEMKEINLLQFFTWLILWLAPIGLHPLLTWFEGDNLYCIVDSIA